MDKTLTPHRNAKLGIQKIKDFCSNPGLSDGCRKAVDLTFEENTLEVDGTTVETWFVDGGTELEVTAENLIDVFLPQST
jgi:hypothetical protein